MMTDVKIGVISVLGGTGKEGAGLALRWAQAGASVIIGSRQLEKALRVASELNTGLGRKALVGMQNSDAAVHGDVVVLTVPYAAHLKTLGDVRDGLHGKVLVDVTVPLDTANVRRVQMPPAGSATQEAQEFLGDGVRVVAAFQNISASHLRDPDEEIDCDVLVCGDDSDAKQVAIQLAELAGMRGFDAGPVENAVVVEGLTSVLISVNIRYKAKGAGMRITGLKA